VSKRLVGDGGKMQWDIYTHWSGRSGQGLFGKGSWDYEVCLHINEESPADSPGKLALFRGLQRTAFSQYGRSATATRSNRYLCDSMFA